MIGNFDGDYLSISCNQIPDIPNSDATGIWYATSTYLTYFENMGTVGYGVQSSLDFCNSGYFGGSYKLSTSTISTWPAGTYYYGINARTVGQQWTDVANVYSLQFTWNGSTITSYASTTIPAIYSFSYSTTTEYANITGYWEATTTPNISQRLSFWQFSNQFGQEDYVQVIATTTGLFNFSFPFRGTSYSSVGGTTTAPILTSFTLNASLDEYNENYYDPFGQLGIDTSGYITNLDATSTTISGYNYGVNDYSTSTRALALYPEYECGITSLTGCFKNAIIWAFYPTQETLDNLSGLFDLIKSKAPIGYFYMTKDSISGLSATSTPSFSVSIPNSLRTNIFEKFDLGIGGILWLFFIFNFYKRLKHITI